MSWPSCSLANSSSTIITHARDLSLSLAHNTPYYLPLFFLSFFCKVLLPRFVTFELYLLFPVFLFVNNYLELGEKLTRESKSE